jgi:FlaA1/EpsC-like NDP-sugar epimerase
VKFGAKKLVLFDISEFALYAIDREIRALTGFENLECEIVPVLGSVTDRELMLRIFRSHKIETVYHAAAYKHVPLVEQNVVVAVRNNVLGTLHLTHAIVDAKVRNFVLISSDKAVRPTSVMGASKRVCELIVQAMALEHPQVRMSMVRFGNVLASSGSVVPLFKEQIARSGPVTITHPDITRYFMTIPEAAQLVIQAGALGGAGEVFVLDMGEPVRIADLAERMIHLSGLQLRSETNPDGDIDIVYTGLRPGEKLFEELMIGKSREATQHPRIFLDNEKVLRWSALSLSVKRLEKAIETGATNEVLAVFRSLVDGFGSTETHADTTSEDKDLLPGVIANGLQGQVFTTGAVQI